jgi:hypothetical protein
MAIFNLKHSIDSYYTHQPVTSKILSLAKPGDTVLELGCGYGSTPLFNFFAKEKGIIVHTFESDVDWLNKFINEYSSTSNHHFYGTSEWSVLEKFVGTEVFLSFIDQTPWEARSYSFNLLKDSSKYIILHDCDYFPDNGLLGRTIKKIESENSLGERDYSDCIKYSKEHFPLPGEFKYLTGPPTLLASQSENVGKIKVDYAIRDIQI